jgi:hypothetical protein
MRVRTLEIRWHDSKPISTCDFQPAGVHTGKLRSARPATEAGFPGQVYRLATGGEDNHVRVSASSWFWFQWARGGRVVRSRADNVGGPAARADENIQSN